MDDDIQRSVYFHSKYPNIYLQKFIVLNFNPKQKGLLYCLQDPTINGVLVIINESESIRVTKKKKNQNKVTHCKKKENIHTNRVPFVLL